MPNVKRFISAIMAVVMVLGMFSCLGTVFASANYLNHTVVNGVYNGTNGTGINLGQVTFKGYRSGDWGEINSTNFHAFNRQYQNYNNGFGIKTYDQLCAEYNGGAFLYYGLEVYEADGELTDHYVQPEDTLTLRVYIKSNLATTGFAFPILMTRSFFNVNGSKASSCYWTETADKGGDGLNNTGYMTSKIAGNITELNEDNEEEFMLPTTFTLTLTPKPVWDHQSFGTHNSGLDNSILYALDMINVLGIPDVQTSQFATMLDTDEWYFEFPIAVRSDAEPQYKASAKDKTYTPINPVPEGAVGEIGYDYRISRDYNSKIASYFYVGEDDSVDVGEGIFTFDYPGICIFDTRDANHAFIIGEPQEVTAYTATFSDGGSPIASLEREIYDGDTIQLPTYSKPGATLVGWSDGTTTYAPGGNYTVSGDVNFTAVWGHTVTYIVDGTTYETQTYNVGDTITLPTPPTKEGSVFGGWAPSLPTTMGDSDITVTATWQAGSYTLTFKSEGGSVISSSSVQAGTTITAPEPPAKEGYDFAAWSGMPADGKMPSSDLILTATYTPHIYSITYVLGNGQPNNVVDYAYGATVATPSNPSRTGYSFSGWDTGIPSTMPAQDVTINATWSPNTYNAVFYIAGQSEPYATIPAVFGTEIDMPALPTETGYTFSAWTPAGTTMDAEGKTYTTTKTANSYTITFYTRDGGTISSGLQTYGQPVVFPTTGIPTVPGMTFKGWLNEDGEFIGSTATVPAGNTYFTANYEGNSHTLTVIIDGVTNSYTRAYGNPLGLEAPVKPGYRFTGWLGDDGVLYTNRSTMPDKDLTVTAQFAVQQYTITFDTKGGTEIAPVSGYYGDPVPAISEPSRTGYSFAGWSQDIPSTFTEDLTIEALWNINSYTVTYKLFADSEEVWHSFTKLYGEAITDADKAETPSLEGYTFNGWDTTLPARMPARDIVIIAQFTSGTYALTYYIRETESGAWTKYGTDSYGFGATINVRPVKTQTGWTYSDWSGIPADGKMPAANVDVYSTGTKNIYTDTWYDVDGTVVATRQVAYGDPIPTIQLPVHEGYTGAYWYPNDTVQRAEDMSFYYRSQAGQVNYTVKYYIENVDGEYDLTTEQRSATTGDRVEATAAMTSRTGYDFDAANSVTVIAAVAGDGSSEIIIRFNLKTYKIYIKDDNDVTVNELTYKYGQAITVPTAPDKEGYTFNRWTWTRENGNAINTFPATMPAYNFIGKASYTINSYTITYYLEGEQYGNVETYTYGQTVRAKPEPTRPGATFSGWAPAVPSTMPAYDLVINGSFATGTYTIIYMADGAEVGRVNAAYGTDITDRIPAGPDKEGYTFLSWSPAITTMPAENVTVNAVYRINSYNAYFYDAENGNLIATKRTNYGAQIEAPANPSKVGYEFAGWNTEVGTIGAADVTFFATWNAKEYSVVFYAIEGDAVAFDTITNVTFGTTFEAPETNPDRGSAYNFVGWKLVGTSGNATVSFPYTMNAEGLTFVGVWEQNTDSCLVQSVVRVTENYYSKGYAEYDVTLLAGIKANRVTINDGAGRAVVFTKASFVINGSESSGIMSITTNASGCEVWRVAIVLAAAENVYKAYCKTEDGYEETLENALVFNVAYDEKSEDVIKAEFTGYEIQANSVVRGNYILWSFDTTDNVSVIKLTGKYTLSDGTAKTVTTLYKYDSTSSNVNVNDYANGTRHWAINMRFTYVETADGKVDLTVTENWTISYKVGNASEYNVVNPDEPVTVLVGSTSDALNPATTGYDKYTLVSAATESASVTKGVYTPVTIVTTDDCTKVRIGTAGKYTTYQTTSAKASYVDANGLRTWTIQYKFTADGSAEYTVNARGSVWGDPQTFNVVVG